MRHHEDVHSVKFHGQFPLFLFSRSQVMNTADADADEPR